MRSLHACCSLAPGLGRCATDLALGLTPKASKGSWPCSQPYLTHTFLRLQNGQTATDGLYAGPTALSMDAVNIVRRMRLLGFNAVRMPYSMQNLINSTARDFQFTNCPNIAASDLLASVAAPGINSGAHLAVITPQFAATATEHRGSA